MVAVQNYAQLYPERRQPDRSTFRRQVIRLNEIGNLGDRSRNRGANLDNVSEINVLAQVHANPEVSQREIGKECNLSQSQVQKFLKKNKFHYYKYQPTQSLHPGDNERRLQFCHWFRDQLREDPNFTKTILWSDESLFTNKGMFNRRNQHFYATENPHLIRQVRPQIRFSLNVWCGLLNETLLGPFFIQGHLTGQTYLHFLQNELEEMLDNLDLRTLRNLRWFQHDGAAPHNSLIVRNYLDERFPDCWIGTRGPVPWPARSPCLNPLDYFLWGYAKDMVYSRAVQNVQQLRQRVVEVFDSITPQQIQNVVGNMDKRTLACIQYGGGHFEQFL